MVNPIIDETIPLANINRMLDGNNLHGQAANAGVNPYLKELQLAFLNGINSLTTTSDAYPGAKSIGVRTSAYPSFGSAFTDVDDAIEKIGNSLSSLSSGNADSYQCFVKYPYANFLTAGQALVRADKTMDKITATVTADSGLQLSACSSTSSVTARGDATNITTSTTTYLEGGSSLEFDKTSTSNTYAGIKIASLSSFTMSGNKLRVSVEVPSDITPGIFSYIRFSVGSSDSVYGYQDKTVDVFSANISGVSGKFWTIELDPAAATPVGGWSSSTSNTQVMIDIYVSTSATTFNNAHVDHVVLTEATKLNINVRKNGILLKAVGQTYTLPDVKVGTVVEYTPTSTSLLKNDIITWDIVTTGTYAGEGVSAIIRTL